MSNEQAVIELVEHLIRIENERKLLQEELKDICDQYKNTLDVKAVKAALRIAKIKAGLGDSAPEVDRILETVESKITV
ncbi:MAG TPA: DUF2312 domain-containing protein [Pseudomonadales bacterium]|nr:DUF2312 domain-containing protein [Pseudomonadales bacterium]